MGDLRIKETGDGGDVILSGNDIEVTRGWGNMIYLRLFGGNYNESFVGDRRQEEIRKDFWANSILYSDDSVKFKSRTEEKLYSTQLNSKGRNEIQQAVESDLSFMDSFANVSVDVSILSYHRVEINVYVSEPDNLESKEFQFIWDKMKEELEGLETEPDDITYQDYQVSGGISSGGFSLSGYQTYTLTFEANSSKYNAVTIDQQGTIQQIDAPSGTTLYKSTSSSPYQTQVSAGDSVSEGDIVTVELSLVPTSQVKVEVVVSYSDVSVSKTLSEDLGGDSNYYYTLNYPDAEIKAFNVTSKAITTIALPASYTAGDKEISMFYRYHDKTIRVFYKSTNVIMLTIDCDPTSANFNTIISNVVFTTNNMRCDAMAYDQVNDYIVAYGEGTQGIYDISGNKLRDIRPSTYTIAAYNSYLLNITYAKHVSGGGYNAPISFARYDQIYEQVYNSDVANINLPYTMYNYVNGLLYTGNGDILNSSNFNKVAAISVGTPYGGIAIDYQNQIGITSHSYGTDIAKIDLSTNTLVGTEQLIDTPSLPVYSFKTKLMYCKLRNRNNNGDKMVIIDPTNSPGSMVIDTIVIGNYDGSIRHRNHQCMNNIVL